MNPRGSRFLLILLSLALLSPAMGADYNADNNKYKVGGQNADVSGVLPVETAEDIAYNTMPKVYERLEEATGREIEYSYIMICVGDECMPVDPFRFSN